MLSCLPVSLFPEIFSGRILPEQWSQFAAELQLDAYDISILFVRDRTPVGLKKLRIALERSGLPLAMVATYPDFTAPDRIHYEREVLQCLADIGVAAALGGKYVRITAGQFYPYADPELQLEQVCCAFQTCAEYAQRLNITILWENHSKPGAWERPDYNYDPGRLDAMLSRLRGGPVRMNYDIANASLLGRELPFLRICFPEIASVHINDVADAASLRFAGIGEGNAPVAQSLQWLKRHNYSGLYSIEEASGKGWEGVRTYVAKTRALLSD